VKGIIPEELNEGEQEPNISSAVLVELFFKKDPKKPDRFTCRCGRSISQKRLKGFTNLVGHLMSLMSTQIGRPYLGMP
jgi:hypothetical protein